MPDQKQPLAPQPAPADSKVEGEGNYTAARAFDRDQHRFAQSGKVGEKAREAERSLDPDKAELDKAEAEGKRHSHGEDPKLKR